MAITWLHISDLHRGQPGDKRWPVSKKVILDDIVDHVARLGQPDLVLFTGDLAFAGTESDYRLVDDTLAELYECIGPDAILVSVPGNHDLVRPHKFDLSALACKQYFDDPNVRGGLLEAHKSTLGFLGDLFTHYSNWWGRSVFPKWKSRGLKHTPGLLPGDFVVSFEKGDLRLGIAGLNSAFLHFGDLDEGELALEYEQLGRVKDLPRWRDEHDASLLLMHHPREWLDKSSQRVLFDSIYPGNSFTGCCFGHMHENAAETVTGGGSETRRWLQAGSLFGLEQYGRKSETRSVGYAWGKIERVDARTGVLTRWPRVARRTEGGSFRMFDGDVNPYPHVETVSLRERRPRQVCRVSVVAVPSEFPFVETSLVRRIEELRPGLVCDFVSAEADSPQTEGAELEVVLVGGLQGKGTTLPDAIARKQNLVLQARSFEAKHLLRPDWNPQGLAALVAQRSDLLQFATEDEILGHVRPALDKVCPRSSFLIQDQVDGQFVSYVLRDLEGRRKEAHEAFSSGDFERALHAYDDLVHRTEELRASHTHSDEVESAWARSRLNLAACHLAIRDIERAREILISVEPQLLSTAARVVLAKALVTVREMTLAETAASTLPASDSERIRQLIAVSLGRVPSSKPDAGDQLIYGAQLLIKEDRFRTALDWILSALPRLENEVLGKLAALEAMMHLLEDWAWAEEWTDALSPIDSQTLLTHIDGLLQDLGSRKLPRSHAQRVCEIEYGLAGRTDDQDRLEAARSRLFDLGHVPRLDVSFDEAIKLGRAGAVAAALEIVGKDDHPWRGRVRQIGVLTVLGDHSAALEASLRLVEEFPNRLTTEYEAARQLMRARRFEGAVSHAERAFAAVPGYGPRLLLAEALLGVERDLDCATTAKPLAEAGDPLALSLYAQAMERTDLKEAIRAWRDYDSKKDELHVKVRIAALELRAGLTSEAAEHGWAIIQGPNSKELSVATLHELALLQAVGSPLEAPARVTQIARMIKQRVSSPADEAFYLQLWSWLRAPKLLPSPDLDRLVEGGALTPLTDTEVLHALESGAALASNIGEAYRLGHVPFEAAVAELRWNVARYALSLGAEAHLPAIGPPEPDIAKSKRDAEGEDDAETETDPEAMSEADEEEPAAFEVRRLLVSELELLVCEKLGLLERLESALAPPAEILLFEDVRLRFLQTLAVMRLGVPSVRLAEVQAIVAVLMNRALIGVGSVPSDTPTVGENLELATIIAWLQEAGAISRTRAQSLVPVSQSVEGWQPAGALAVNAAALRWLVSNGLVETLVAAVGAPLLVSDQDRFQLELKDATREVEALRLCERVHSWLELRFERGTARSVTRPAVEVPPAKTPAVQKVRDWVAMALGWRVAADQLDAHCFSLDACVSDLFSGIYLPQILHSIKWSQQLYLDAKERFRAQRSRVVGMRWLAGALKVDLEQRERMAAIGAVDVMDAATLASLQREYEPGAAALERILRIIEAPLQEPRHAKNISAQFLVGRAYAAVVKRLLDEQVGDAATFMSHTLGRWNGYEGRSIGGLLAFTLPAVFDKPTTAYRESSPGKYTPDASSSAGRLFEAIVEWAKADEKRLTLLSRAAAEVVVLIDKAAKPSGPTSIVVGVLQLLAELMPDKEGADLTNELMSALAIMGGVWERTPLETMGISVSVVRDGSNDAQTADLVFQEMLAEGVGKLGKPGGPKLNPLWADWDKEVLGGRVAVRCPVESVVLRAPPEVASQIARELAALQGPNDGAMYETLREFAEQPEAPQIRHQLARRSVQSPWKQILRDPTTLAVWGRADGVHVGAPIDLETLLKLLSEPAGLEQEVPVLKRLEAYVEGAWRGRSDKRDLFMLAASTPGVAGAQVANALADDELDDAIGTLSRLGSASFAELWTCLTALWIAAAGDRSVTLNKVSRPARELLQEYVDSSLTAILADPARGRLEAQLLQRCREVVGRFHPSSHDSVWLTYRLFGWLWKQIRSQDAAEVRAVLDQFTSWSRVSYGDTEPRDPMDPLMWHSLPDLRLVSLANVIALGDGLPLQEGSARWWFPVTDSVREHLVRVASTEITDTDRSLRQFKHSQWQWISTAMPQESALFLLLRESDGFLRLEMPARLRWLQELPNGQPGHGIDEEPLVGRLLIGAAASLPRLTDLEKATLAERLTESTSKALTSGPAQAIALLALQREGFAPAPDTVWSRIRNHLSDDPPGAAMARLYAEALVRTRATDLSTRLKTLMDTVRGPSSAELTERIEADPIFVVDPELVKSIRELLSALPEEA